MRRCRTCLYPDTKPDLYFDETGQCSACTAYTNRPQVDWESRREELVRLLDRHNGRVIVASSGGKDSTYIALTLKEMGADVTAVTATTCMLSALGRANIDNLTKHVPTIEVTPNRTVRAKLNRLGLMLVGDASWPQHASIWSIPFRMAIATRTPLVMFGENSQDQYGGPLESQAAKQMTSRWITEFGGFNGLRASDFVGMEEITTRDMEFYTLPAAGDINEVGVEAHFLGAYIPWDSRRNAEFSLNHGMRQQRTCDANWWFFENLDCLVTPIHDAAMYRKFGYGRGAAQISMDIRSGMVNRGEALTWAKEHDGLFPFEYLGVSYREVLDHIGMREFDFWKTLDSFTNADLFDGEADHRPLLKEESCSPPA